MDGEHRVGRVIARPFEGAPGALRTAARAGATTRRRRRAGPTWRSCRTPRVPVHAVGKVRDLFAGRGHRRQARGEQQREGDRGDHAAAGRARRRADLREPGRHRPGLRPPQGRRGLPRRAARDRRRAGGLARPARPRRPARADRRPRRGPGRPAHRPHARVRAAARGLRGPRRPPPRRPARRRGRERAALADRARRAGAARAVVRWPDVRRVCVFCGSSPGARPAYAEATAEVARLLVADGIGVVYGGGARRADGRAGRHGDGRGRRGDRGDAAGARGPGDRAPPDLPSCAWSARCTSARR